MTHGGEEKIFDDAISFVEYSNGKVKEGSDYNIVRNHIYRFLIRSIAGDNLKLEYHVADWDAEDWGTGKDYEEHNISYPTYVNPIVPAEYLTLTPDKQNDYVIKSEPTMYYGGQNNLEAGAFVGYFRIVQPLNVHTSTIHRCGLPLPFCSLHHQGSAFQRAKGCLHHRFL